MIYIIAKNTQSEPVCQETSLKNAFSIRKKYESKNKTNYNLYVVMGSESPRNSKNWKLLK